MSSWWSETWLVAARDLRERTQARSYWIVSVILVLAVAAAVVIPTLISHHRTTETVGLVAPAGAKERQAALTAGRVTGSRVRLVSVPDVPAARSGLRSGALGVAVVAGREVLIKQRSSGGSRSAASTASFAGTLAQLVGVVERLPPAVVSTLARGVALPVRAVEPPPESVTRRVTGLGVALLIYIVILFYGMRITQTVGEEKGSRVVEVLLATVRPTQLLTGKVIGFGGAAMAQIAALAAVFLACSAATGSQTLHGGSIAVVGVGVLWLLLGFALYSIAFAAAGSMITRQSDAANAAMPLLIPLILTYALTNGVLFGSVTPFYRVLAFIPWTAPIAMPTLVAVGAASAPEVIVSALLCLAATVGTARVAGIVYGRSVLRTGARVRLRQVLGRGAA